MLVRDVKPCLLLPHHAEKQALHMTDALQAFAGSGISSGRNAATTCLSAAVSLAMHGAVFAAAILWMEDKPGAVDLLTEAISVELFHTEVIEATTVSAQLLSAPALASTESEAGSEVAQTASEAHFEEVPETTTPLGEVAVKTLDDLDIIRGESAIEGASQRPSRPERNEGKRIEQQKPAKAAKLTEPTETKAKDSSSTNKGGPRSRAARGSASSSGRISASSGSALNYAATVRARVAGRKPPGHGRRGIVVVSFGVTRSGGLSYASVARSSGNPGLDSSVLSAVRSAAPFPTPPAGAQLRFAMPFYFR